MSDSRRVAWKLSDGSSLAWRSWNGEYVVFNAGSGDTHLMNSLAAEALKQLEHAPADASELSRRVAQALAIADDVVLRRHIEKLLADFDELGLIDPDDA